jgi:hypothetical protein
MKSKFLKLTAPDWLKGLVMAFIGAIVAGVYQLFQTGSALNWITLKPILFVAIGTALSYLIKNFFSNSAGQFATSESGKGLKFPKALVLILMFSSVGLISNAQIGLFKPIPKAWNEMIGNTNVQNLKVSQIASLWVPRLNVGIQGVSYELKSNAKPLTLNAVCFGVGWLHYKDVDNAPFNDFGINVLALVDTQTQGFGLGVYGTYNILGSGALFNLGTHYDFTMKEELIDTGISFHF